MFIKDKNKYKAVVIGGSAGSFPVVSEIFSKLKDNFHLPIFLAPHRLKHVREGFSEALSTKSNIPIIEPFDKDLISSGKVYLAPSNYHMSVENDFRIITDLWGFGELNSTTTIENISFTRFLKHIIDEDDKCLINFNF